jgi:hypothetical protein
MFFFECAKKGFTYVYFVLHVFLPVHPVHQTHFCVLFSTQKDYRAFLLASVFFCFSTSLLPVATTTTTCPSNPWRTTFTTVLSPCITTITSCPTTTTISQRTITSCATTTISRVAPRRQTPQFPHDNDHEMPHDHQ